MKARYYDITKRLGEPLWWDENGTPRYDQCSPEDVADIYARVVVFLLIGCQSCDKRMMVAVSWNHLSEWNPEYWQQVWGEPDGWKQLYEHVKNGPYGDPPEHGDLCGETMNSIPLCVLEFWHRERGEWSRVVEFEGPINCAWSNNEQRIDRV